MSKDSFTFKQFSVHQDRCAMKVGTDGTLLGAWTFAPNAECRILDIGTGTGLIALMMAQRYPRAFITAIDIDSDACAQAKENVNNSPYKDRIEVICCDIRDYESDMFDVIVSNPPYISYDEKIDDIVRNNEPSIALFAENNGLYFYEKILKDCYNYLNDKSLIAFEIGCTQGDIVSNIARKYFPNSMVVVEKDLSLRDRYVFIFNNLESKCL